MKTSVREVNKLAQLDAVLSSDPRAARRGGSWQSSRTDALSGRGRGQSVVVDPGADLLDLPQGWADLQGLDAGQRSDLVGGELEQLVEVAAVHDSVQVVRPGDGRGERHLGHPRHGPPDRL